MAAEWEGSGKERQQPSSPIGKVKETNTTLMLKALANAVGDEGSGEAEKVELKWLRKVIEGVGRILYGTLVKAQKVAFATVLFK